MNDKHASVDGTCEQPADEARWLWRLVRHFAAFVLALILGPLWLISFLVGYPFVLCWKLNGSAASEWVDNHFGGLGDMLRWVRGPLPND